MFLGSEEIKRLILEKGMIKNYIDLDLQLQPNGFDLTIEDIHRFTSEGAVYNKDKNIASIDKIFIDGDECWKLYNGTYLMSINETVNLPNNIAAVTIQRSSLMRSGVTTNIGSWDGGYRGKGYSLLMVHNTNGFTLQRNSRVIQMHFIRIEGSKFSYNGSYQNENLDKHQIGVLKIPYGI